ncbi:MAG: leucine-rich repeat protein [Clostridia bacterium]|nr:leucine-rich repeat protein [Clostridia bacterium]
MKKALTAVLLGLVLFILMSVPASAATVASGTCGPSVSWTLSTTGVLSITGSGVMKNYDYRTTVSEKDDDGYYHSVSNPDYLVAPWNAYKDSILSVSIGSGITSIGDYAFYGCGNMTAVSIPESVTYIWDYAFADCGSLSISVLPSSVISIGDYAFRSCTALTSLDLRDLRTIGIYAFTGCTNLRTVILGNDLTNINLGGGAFSGCSSLTSVTLPASLTCINSKLFYKCSSLQNISIPSAVTRICAEAFSGCSSLTAVSLPAGLLEIEYDAFLNCAALKTVTLNGNTVLKSVGNRAFYGCTSLTGLPLPDSVSALGSEFISGCTSFGAFRIPAGVSLATGSRSASIIFNGAGFTSVTIPAGATEIGSYTFSNCKRLKEVIFESHDTLTRIKDYAFSSTAIEQIDLPDSVVQIDEAAFSNCTALKEVWLPASWTRAPATSPFAVKADFAVMGPFYGCSSLTTLHFDDNITTIPNKAFYGSGLTRVELPDHISYMASVPYPGEMGYSIAFPTSTELVCYAGTQTARTLGDRATLRDMPLASVGAVDPVTVRKDGTHQLSVEVTTASGLRDTNNYILFTSADPSVASVTALGKITGLNEGRTRIIISAVSGSPSVTADVTVLPANTAAYGNVTGSISWMLTDDGTLILAGTGATGSFSSSEAPWNEYLADIRKVIIQEGITSVGDDVFPAMPGLTELTLPSTVTSVGMRNFMNCTSLETLSLPEGLTGIGHFSFSGCTSLTAVYFPLSLTSVRASAFDGCTALTDVHYGGTTLDRRNISFHYYSTDEITVCALNGSSVTWHCVPRVIASGSICNDSICWEINDQGLMTFTGTGDMPEYASHYFRGDTEYVEYLNAPWASYYTRVTRIGIGEGITRIGANSFASFNMLESVQLPSTLNTISEHAFIDCVSLAELNCPDSVSYIGDEAFSGCTSLSGFGFPSSLTFIGRSAFENSGLTSAILPDRVTSVGKYCFRNCLKLTRASWPRGAASFAEGAFYDCENLKTVTIPSTVTKTADGTFGGTFVSELYLDSIESWLALTDQVPSDQWHALPNSIGINKCSMNVYVAGRQPDTVVIPDGTARIRGYAFRGFKNTHDLIIPESVTEIGTDAFAGCTGLQSIHYAGDLLSWLSIMYSNPDGLPDRYATRIWLNGELLSGDVMVPDGITYLRSYAFSDLQDITSVRVPESVTTLNQYSLSGLMNAEIFLPDNITDLYFGIATAFGKSTSPAPKAVYCKAGSRTAAELSKTALPGFTDPEYPDFLLKDVNGISAVVAFSGSPDRVTIPACVNKWIGNETRIQSLTLPENLSAGSRFDLNAFRVDIPDGVSDLSGVTLRNTGKIRVPDSVTVFDGFELIPPEGVTPVVYCYMNSEAEIWAMLAGYDIVYLDDADWEPVLSYTGPAVALEPGETRAFTTEEFTIEPLPDIYTGIISLNGDGLITDGLSVTGGEPGDHILTAFMDGYSTDIPVHVYARVTELTVSAPSIVERGSSFTVSVEAVTPENTSGMLTWLQDGSAVFTDDLTSHTFTAPENADSTVITLSAPGGYERSVTVIIPRQLVYNGPDIMLEIGESAVLDPADLVLSPVPEDYEADISLYGAGITVSGMTVTAVSAGDFLLTASQYGCTAEIGVHVYAAVTNFELSAPAIALRGSAFEVRLTGTEPEGISGVFTWMQDGRTVCSGTETARQFTAPESAGETVIRVSAPGGLYREARVRIPQSISAPSLDPLTAEYGETVSVIVEIDGEIFTDDPATWLAVELPESSKDKFVLENGSIRVIGLGRGVITIIALDGTRKNIVVTAADTKHADRITVPGTPATCSATGLTEGTYCAICGEVLVPQEVIPATHIHHMQSGICVTCGSSFDISAMDVLRLPDALVQIDPEAMSGTAAEAVIVPPACTRIGSRAFAACPNLKYIFLPEGVSIAEDAFDGCTFTVERIIGQ